MIQTKCGATTLLKGGGAFALNPSRPPRRGGVGCAVNRGGLSGQSSLLEGRGAAAPSVPVGQRASHLLPFGEAGRGC